MKINSSAVAMTSEHRAFSYAETTRLTMEAPTSDNAAAAILTLSSKCQSGNVQDAMVEYQENQKKEQEQQDKQGLYRHNRSDIHDGHRYEHHHNLSCGHRPDRKDR